MKKALKILIFTIFWVPQLPTSGLTDPDDTGREGGILGTGIVGTITSLGSIYVNGQHIAFETKMPVADGVSVSQANELRPGHTVAVVAHRDGTNWRTTHIRQILPLVGPLRISDDGQYNIMGTDIVTDGVAFLAAPGDWVAVSGLWRMGQVMATQIDRVNADVGARIEGSALDFNADGALRLGGTDILGLLPQHIQEGDVIRAFGSPSSSTIQVSKFETGVFDTETGVILAEGYLSTPRPSGTYTVLGTNVVSFTDNPAMIDATVRFFACGKDGELTSTISVSDDPANLAPFLSDCLIQGLEKSRNTSD